MEDFSNSSDADRLMAYDALRNFEEQADVCSDLLFVRSNFIKKMAAAINMNVNVEQVPEGQYQQMFIPQMVPVGFVAMPEFCEGMWVQPMGGYGAAWHQGAYRGPMHKKQFAKNRNFGSPAHTPQMPPQDLTLDPDANSEDPVSIELTSLPKMLCTKPCLEASLEQAGLEGQVESMELSAGGKAVLVLKDLRAAQRCMKHFHGLQWAKSSQPVSARVLPTGKEPSKQEPKQSQPKKASQPQAAPKPAKENAAKKLAEPVKSPKQVPSSPALTATTVTQSPKSSFLGSPSLRPRWADLESDDEDDIATGTPFDSALGSSDSDN